MDRFAAVALSVAATASAQGMPGQGPWGMHDGWSGWWWPMGGLVWLLILGLAVIGLMTLIRRLFGQSAKAEASSEALKSLDARYARGEIEREDYLRRKQDISASG